MSPSTDSRRDKQDAGTKTVPPTAVLRDGETQPEEQLYRGGAYNLLATLLRTSPGGEALSQTAALPQDAEGKDELTIAISMLGLAARTTTEGAVNDEYHALFIGLGRGELVPYGSWYLTGFLMERPLSLLRDDLVELGFERNEQTREPEDHVAALCEVMALLISEGQPLDRQSRFFETHLLPWMGRFFRDLSTADNAVFYRAVGRFGVAFAELEQRYLEMKV